MLNTMQRQVVFIRKFFQSPRRIGAIAPSSSALAQEIVRQANVCQASAILELGPGTGSFTREIVVCKPAHARLLSIEADAGLAVLLRKKFETISIAPGYAQKARRIMKAYAFPAPDCIVSGLPWAVFDTQTQRDILAEAKTALKPGGIFTTFAYIHALSFPEAKAFRSLLERSFHSVETSRIIWNNLPPAIVYRCKKENG
jgi:phosphatidylethanolamine/phosphatidyl-N-methylethanolamine N-methyltransferase